MSRCCNCSQYEEDTNDDTRGWCHKEHKWVDWNDSPEFTNCED